jgi:hypothetical protein
LIYGNENESLLEFSNILFNYVDKKIKRFWNFKYQSQY